MSAAAEIHPIIWSLTPAKFSQIYSSAFPWVSYEQVVHPFVRLYSFVISVLIINDRSKTELEQELHCQCVDVVDFSLTAKCPRSPHSFCLLICPYHKKQQQDFSSLFETFKNDDGHNGNAMMCCAVITSYLERFLGDAFVIKVKR